MLHEITGKKLPPVGHIGLLCMWHKDVHVKASMGQNG